MRLPKFIALPLAAALLCGAAQAQVPPTRDKVKASGSITVSYREAPT